MPYIPDNEWAEVKSKLSALDARMEKVERTTKNIRGEPIIQGYAGKRLDLNENLDVIKTLKRITDLE